MAVTQVVTRLGYGYEYSLGQLAPLRTFARYFWVYSDTKDENPENVRTASELPQIGDLHPVDEGAQAASIRIRRDEERLDRWEVEVQYSSDNPRKEKDKPDDIEALTKISVQTRQGQKLIERRLDGTAILNSAYDLIEGIQLPWNSLALVIEQYRTSAPDYYVTSKWINAINSATWRGVPQYFAQIESLNYDFVKFEGSDCWKRVAVVKLAHPDQDYFGFRHHVLDAGLREYIDFGDGPVYSQIRDDRSQTLISKPVPLNGSGAKLAPSGTPVYINASPFPELAFATLGI